MEMAVDRPIEASRARPEIRHAARMRIGAQAAARCQFAAEVLQLLLCESTFEESPSVDAGRRVRLQIDDVAAVGGGAIAEEMIEADFEQGRRGRVGRDVAAQARAAIARLQDHRHGVPANDAFELRFQLDVTGIARLSGDAERVAIWRIERKLRGQAGRDRCVQHLA